MIESCKWKSLVGIVVLDALTGPTTLLWKVRLRSFSECHSTAFLACMLGRLARLSIWTFASHTDLRRHWFWYYMIAWTIVLMSDRRAWSELVWYSWLGYDCRIVKITLGHDEILTAHRPIFFPHLMYVKLPWTLTSSVTLAWRVSICLLLALKWRVAMCPSGCSSSDSLDV